MSSSLDKTISSLDESAVAEPQQLYGSGRRSPQDHVQYVRGVGPSVALLLAKLNVTTAADLLMLAPARYEDRSSFVPISNIRVGQAVTIRGIVTSAEVLTTSRKNFKITRVVISDNDASAVLTYFQQPYLIKQFQSVMQKGSRIVAFGQVKQFSFGLPEIDNAEWEEEDIEGDNLSTGCIVPVYPLTEGLSQKRIRRIMDSALSDYNLESGGVVPQSICRLAKLISRSAAIRNLHFPQSWATLREARRRIVYDEFLLLQVGLGLRRKSARSVKSSCVLGSSTENKIHDLESLLGFQLTLDQKNAIESIARDFASGRPMNRLLQGDVGSGKTAVAIGALLMIARSGWQGALMAPTEILAQQHYNGISRILLQAGITTAVATGSSPKKERDRVKDGLRTGDIQVVIGTHALLEEDVQFRNLGLAIVDEQHRFGVLQRRTLQLKSRQPHVLVMTATPIPRTLTMTLYGDLDTTVIRELPPGRKPVKTHWKSRSEAQKVYKSASSLIDEGRQVYVVCPLVEESEKLQVKAAAALAEHIQKDLLPSYRIGLLHGQLKPDEKRAVMRRFKAHEIDVLVATTIIEVGVDIPNASVMIVEDAERFGLAQLHQLRGRVGRGEHPGYCILVSDPVNESGRSRLQVMTQTTDGFVIAEEDLRIRGPGEYSGVRQSGLPANGLGDLIQDAPIMAEARAAASDILMRDSDLKLPENAYLRAALLRNASTMELTGIS